MTHPSRVLKLDKKVEMQSELYLTADSAVSAFWASSYINKKRVKLWQNRDKLSAEYKEAIQKSRIECLKGGYR